MYRILLLQKVIQLKLPQIKLAKKTNESAFGPKNKDVIKDLLELKNTVKNSKIKTIKKIFQSHKIKQEIIEINAKTAKLRLKNIMIMMILNTKVKRYKKFV